MALQNRLAPKTEQEKENKISVYLGKEGVKAKLLETLGDQRALKIFASSIAAAIANNPKLQKCDIATVVSAGLQAVGLGLPLSPSLGQASLVPFEDNKNDRTVATFIIGYKGYIQLAMRSGLYRKIIISEVKKGELIKNNIFTEEIELKQIDDDKERENAEEIGYYASFELLDGFTKKLYWSKEKMLAHADRYVPAFSLNATNGKYPKVSFADYLAGKYPKGDEWKYSSYWYKNFTGQALKTMIRQLIPKWGPMSIEMQEAYEADTKAMEYEDRMTYDFVAPEQKDEEDNFFEGTTGEETPKEEKPVKKAEKAEKTEKPKKAAEVKEPDDDDDFFGDNPFPDLEGEG